MAQFSLPKYEHFRFKVGQFVRSSFCLAVEDKNQSLRDLFQIVERIYQECPGGVQLHYTCRPHGLLSSKDYIRFNEIELTELPEKESST
jgi:hypothetical protein